MKGPRHRLRWKLCQTWRVPVDHKIFDNINDAQWLWYCYNILEDEKQEFELYRDMVEYHASFIEPEAVRNIKESREKAVELTDSEFASGLKHFFGRSLNIGKRKSNKIESVNPVRAMAEYKRGKANGDAVSANKHVDYKHWLSYNLE